MLTWPMLPRPRWRRWVLRLASPAAAPIPVARAKRPNDRRRRRACSAVGRDGVHDNDLPTAGAESTDQIQRVPAIRRVGDLTPDFPDDALPGRAANEVVARNNQVELLHVRSSISGTISGTVARPGPVPGARRANRG